MKYELSAQIEREVLGWPGVSKETGGGGPGKGGFWVPPATIYRFGRRQLGHVHHDEDGLADFSFPKEVRDGLIRSGQAIPPPRLPGEPDDRELPGAEHARRARGRGTLPHELRTGSRPRKSHRDPEGSNVTENVTKTALVTGASRGLGLALARRLAREGWTLIIDARGEGALETARVELSEYARVVAIPGDVTDPEHRRRLAEAAREAGGLDALVNNASILGPSPQPGLLDYPLDTLEEVYRTNVISPLALVQVVRDHLKPGARVVNVTSDAAVEPYEGWGGYGSSKAALEQLSAILAAENPDLRVYRVDPGDMRTRMQQEAFPDEDISDRPPPEENVPGLLELLTEDLPSDRYRAQDLPRTEGTDGGISELRVALTVENLDEAAALYGDALGLTIVEEWSRPEGRGLILDAGPASIELLDRAEAARVDRIEAGESVSGPVRLAFGVPSVEASASSLRDGGAKAIGGPVHTPWGDLNQRLQAPDGTQLTLFQSAAERPAEKEMV